MTSTAGKRVLSLLLAVLLVVSGMVLAPQVVLRASAADNVGTAEQVGTGHTVQFGRYPQDRAGVHNPAYPSLYPTPTDPYVIKSDAKDTPYYRDTYFLVQPVEWRVLANDGDGLLLVSNQILDNRAFHSSEVNITWQNSALRPFLSGNFLTAVDINGDPFFSGAEAAAIAASSLDTTNEPATSDTVFVLSQAEVEEYFAGNADRKATLTGYASSYFTTSDANDYDSWTIRTPGSYGSHYRKFVAESSGAFSHAGKPVDTAMPIRPALRIDKSSIVMVSSDKPTASAVTPVTLPASGSLKLTLVDSGLSLSGATSQIDAAPGGSFNYSYTGASTGTALSCVLELNGETKYYARLQNNIAASSDTVSVTLPAAIPEGVYDLKFFCEVINSEGSDYASLPVEMKLNVGTSTPVISTTALPDAVVGIAYAAEVQASGQPIPSVDVTGLPSGLTWNAATKTIEGTPASGAVGTHTLSVTANNGTVVTGSLTLTVHPAVEAPQITTAGLSDAALSVPYSETINVAGGAPSSVTQTAGSLPPGINRSGLTLSGTPTNSGTYSFKIKVSNSSGSDEKTFQIVVSASAAPSITTTSMPDGVEGQAYSLSAIAFSGNPAPSISVTSGTFPTGLTLNSDGTISGTPTAAGTYAFTVTAANGITPDATANFSVEIHPAGTNAPVITTTSLPEGMVGAPYSAQISASGNPAPTFAVVSGSLPAGLTLLSDGTISGTPTASGMASFDVEANNGGALSDTKSFTLWIHSSASFVAPAMATTLPDGAVGTAYSETVATGVPTPTLRLVSGTLPAGITIDASLCKLVGTPTSGGAYTFTLEASNHDGTQINTETETYTITITGGGTAPVITTTSLPTAVEGTPYSATISATGTPAPTITDDGNLPPGLSLSGNTISGTPTVAGTYNFNLTATNGNLPDDVKSYAMVVAPAGTVAAPTIDTLSLPDGNVGTAYSETISITGIPAPTLSLSGGSLPPGLSLTGNTIGGTPTVAGSYTFKLKASNGVAPDAEQSFTVLIDDGGGIGPTPSLTPELQNITPNPMRLNLSGRKEGYLTISLGQSGTRAAKAVAQNEGGNTNAVRTEPNPLTDDGYFTVTAQAVGTTTIKITFYDSLDQHMSGYDQSVSVTVVRSSGTTHTSRGGGGGGGSTYDSRSSAEILAMQQESLWTSFIEKIPAAVEDALQKQLEYAAMTIRNAIEMTEARVKEIIKAAQAIGGKIRLSSDTLEDNKVIVRIQVDVDKATDRGILLSGWVEGTKIAGAQSHFQEYYQNKMRFIALEQQGDFGQIVHIAAKVDLSGMDTGKLVFYSYDQKTNTILHIDAPNYFIDDNGYLHFDTRYGGIIIVSEGLLEKR